MKNRHSIKVKMILLLTGIVIGLVALLLLINSTFIESYYLNEKKDSILCSYQQIDGIIARYDVGDIAETGMKNEIERATAPVGISVYVMDGNWETVYSSNKEGSAEQDRLKKSMFEMNRMNMTILEQTDNYTIQKVYDYRMGDYYLEMWGNFSNGDFAMMRLPVQRIKDSINITNRFIQYVGMIVVLLSIIIVYVFASYITRPIKELSDIAERMSELDFNAKYTGRDRGELGNLGHSMNQLSEKLEENISHLKSANIELKKDIENKIQIDEMRKDFLSNVSHELKTPIALIQGYAEGLKEGVSDDPESMEFYCDVIMDEAGKMNNMVKKLLTLNQIEFGEEELVMERFDLTELVGSVVSANELRAAQKDIQIVCDLKEPLYVWSDEYKIEEVITNYLSNAINHCDYEKIVKISAVKQENLVRVSVFNTGDCIPAEDVDNIWVKFYKVDKARTREYGGNGIGLSIVKAIMDSYDKRCGVLNHANGVEFWFELDCKNDENR